MDFPKTGAEETARNIFTGIREEKEDVFPDRMSIQVGAQWMKDSKAVEREFSKM